MICVLLQLAELVEQNPNVAVDCICFVLSGEAAAVPASAIVKESKLTWPDNNHSNSSSSSSSSSSSANGHNNGNHNRFTDGPANEYLLALLSIEISLKNIDVVNRIISVVQLPMEFIHLYVSNCISSCENISNHYMQVYMS
jgi:hypothetical protein